MNFDQPKKLNKEEKEKEIDVFSKSPVIVDGNLVEENIDDWDREFIKNNMDLIYQFDTALNKKQANVIFKEALQDKDKELVDQVYEFVKTKKQERYK